MKYGILFGAIGVGLAAVALVERGGGWVLLWPAMSFGIVSVGYLGVGPRVYGKSPDGTLAPLNVCLLLPYLIALWSIWRVYDWLTPESAMDQLTDRIYIGRRLLNHHHSQQFDHVIDLTCEFNEVMALRRKDYRAFPILDGWYPPTSQLKSWVREAALLPGIIYIHCAAGHGRTGLFAAALLLEMGDFESVDDALAFMRSKRPHLRLNARQLQALNSSLSDSSE